MGLAGPEFDGTIDTLADIGRTHVPEVANFEEEQKEREEKRGLRTTDLSAKDNT